MNFPTLEGDFWMANHPSDVVSGVCTTDKKGLVVRLNGVFRQVRKHKNTFVRLLGMINNNKVTVDKCLLSSCGNQSEYIPNFIFLGEHFDEDNRKLEFSEAKIQLRYLKDWISGGDTGDSKGVSTKSYSEHNYCIQIDYSSYSLLFRQDNPLLFDKIFELSLFLRDFISISVNRPSAVLDLRLICSSSNQKTEVRVFSKRFAYSCCEQRNIPKNIYPSKMLFNYDEFGGLSNIEKWIKNAFRYEKSLRYLRSYWSNEYVENQLTNVASAFEIFHKIRYPKKGFRTLERELCECAFSLFELSGQHLNTRIVEMWSKKIVRNRSTLHNLKDPDYPLLPIMIESVYLLVLINILKNILGNSDAIQRIINGNLFPLIESVAANCES